MRNFNYNDTNTKYDPGGHLLISFIGNYNIQEPNDKQIKAITDLMVWASEEFDIPTDRIYGHYDWTDTGCPGKYLRPYLEDGTLQRAVEERFEQAP